jgi:uncharacterized protein YbaA (DUF1428 family)
MAYIDGCVIPVKTADKDAYLAHARRMAALFQEFGALRMVDAWGDDVPVGKVTDFQRAVQAGDDETIVFCWIEWPDKATRVAAMEKIQTDARMMGEHMPFDGKRMIYGAFSLLNDTAS